MSEHDFSDVPIEDLVAELDGGDTDNYHRALGRFISSFSEAEVNLLHALWRLSSLDNPVGPAVLSGVKIEGAIGLINRLAEAQNWPDVRKDEFKSFSDRLGILNKLRNDILHNGSNWAGAQTWTVTNRTVVHHPSRIRTFPVTAKDLDGASKDLQNINSRIVLFAWGDAMPPAIRFSFETSRQHAWQYIPPPGFERAGTNPKTPPKRPRQPKSSSASRRKDALGRRATGEK